MNTLLPSRLTRLLVVFLAAIGIGFPEAGLALTRIVTSSQDSNTPAAAVPGMLRWEIDNAATTGATLLQFAPGVCGKTITLKAGPLVVASDLTIEGPGREKLTISGQSRSRVFQIQASVTISGLTITKGMATVGADQTDPYTVGGAGILNLGALTLKRSYITSNMATLGGGIYNLGDLVMDECSVNLNRANTGGGIYDQGTALIQRSAIYDNESKAPGGNGGGLAEVGATSQFINVTVSGNSAPSGQGGGIWTNGGTLTYTNVTIAKNKAVEGGGIFWSPTDSSFLRNTIVADNTATTAGPDIRYSGTIAISQGINLIGSTSGVVGAAPFPFLAADKRNVASGLGPLQPNGGLTPTMALHYSSPARDAGDNSFVPPAQVPTDQRVGFVRIFNTTVDIGAYEFIAPRALKEAALADLQDCLATLDPLAAHYKSSRAHITRAICNLQRSLTPRLWTVNNVIDGIHLSNCGGLVFDFEEFAAESLNAEVRDKGQCAGAAKLALEYLLAADEALAQVAVDEAAICAPNSKDLEKAKDYMCKALTAASKLAYREAIEHYEQAWRRARKACGAFDSDDCNQRKCEGIERGNCEGEHPDGGDSDDDGD